MAKQPEEVVADAPKPKSKKGLLIGAIALLLVAAGGGTWFMLGGKHGSDGKPRPVKEVPPVFMSLETFTVNLQPAGSDQYLQTELTLRVADQSVVDMVKQQMPEIRNHLLILLSNKTAEALATTEGKQKLAEDIRAEITRVIDPEAIKAAERIKLRKEPAVAAQTTEGADAAQNAAAPEATAAEAEAAAETPPAPKVQAVLFTSFIIQ